MRFGQIRFENKLTAALFEDGAARPIPGYTTVELIRKSETEGIPLSELLQEMAVRHREPILPAIPISPVEVWASGCTYAPSASFRDGEQGKLRGIYDQVLSAERPEIFFKGTARVCVGPGQPIGIRPDSKFTAPEPEFAVVLGRKGTVVGYTLANDVSAWDIERENPLYLPQSKIYSGCCALGPVIITPDELPDLRDARLECVVSRGGNDLFSGSSTVSDMCRSIEYLIGYLLRANPVPAGSVLLTGTGIIVPENSALAPGDSVAIRMAQIGELANPAAVVQ